MQKSIIINMALTMSGSRSASRTSLHSQTPVDNLMPGLQSPPKKFTMYNGISDRPNGWKPKKIVKTSRVLKIRRWDGTARQSSEWDSLRKDPELWDPNGDCLIYLHGQGQSRRGPAFKVSMDALVKAGCQPVIERFLSYTLAESPGSDADNESQDYFGKNRFKSFELYIPAPSTADREQAFLYHTATRNFFAWVFGKPLVGLHLGCALVALLNSMNEFRFQGADNVQAIMDYMDEEGYADIRNLPDHALAILFFAEHFQFKDLWTDAIVHCCGMNERLMESAGFEFMSLSTRALVTKSRLEMDKRLENCGRQLATFLSDDLSDTYLGLSLAGRAHLDKFRSFLQSYYVAKLGYYPPTPSQAGSAAIPKSIAKQMYTEFQKLYELLVDKKFESNDSISLPHQGGICVLQCTQAFDQRHEYKSLKYSMPLLPEQEETLSVSPSKLGLNRRFTFATRDKMRPDPRLITVASLCKATNGNDVSSFDCALVRAYRGFEKECVLSPSRVEKSERISQTDARKVRWILIYTIMQTLRSVCTIPSHVRDTHNVPYNLSVVVSRYPTWTEQPYEALLRSQTDQMVKDHASITDMAMLTGSTLSLDLKPDIDYVAINNKAQHARQGSGSTLSSTGTTRSTVRRALSTLGNMPELRHPKPQRASYHEILVYGYGNGTNTIITAEARNEGKKPRKSIDSNISSSAGEMSSRWSHTSNDCNDDLDSEATSLSSHGRRRSDSSEASSTKVITEFLDEPMDLPPLPRVPSSIYSTDEFGHPTMQPEPLELRKSLLIPEDCIKITTGVDDRWNEPSHQTSEELLT